MKYPTVTLEQLTAVQQFFLKDNGYMAIGPERDIVPIHVKLSDGSFAKVVGAYCPSNAKGAFVAKRPAEFFLAGIAMLVLTGMGIVCSPDRRRGRQVMCTVHGWMGAGEGPEDTVIREASVEELTVYSVSNINTLAGKTEIVPAGIRPKGRLEYLNVTFENSMEHGSFEFVGVNENVHQPGVIEFMFRWDLRGLGDDVHLCFVQSEEMPDGSILGSNFLVHDIETGDLVGLYIAQQGFFPLDATMHSALVNMMSCIRKS